MTPINILHSVKNVHLKFKAKTFAGERVRLVRDFQITTQRTQWQSGHSAY